MASKKKFIVKVPLSFFISLCAFIAGFIVAAQLSRHVERKELPGEARRLLNIAVALRQGNVDDAIIGIDERAASALYRTASGVADDEMTELPEEALWIWRYAKDYYDRFDVKGYRGTSMVNHVKRKLDHVPWSEFQLAQKEFREKYSNGKLEIAPEFSITHWFGPTVSGKEMHGKVILLDFWNIYCKPCVKSLPTLQKIHDRYKDKGLVVIACTPGLEDETAVFLKKNKYTFPAGIHSEQTYLNYAVEANPTYYLIDRHGRLAWGPEHRLPTDKEIASMLEKNEEI